MIEMGQSKQRKPSQTKESTPKQGAGMANSYLVLLEEHARARPDLAHHTLSRIIVRHHRFLHLIPRLVS